MSSRAIPRPQSLSCGSERTLTPQERAKNGSSPPHSLALFLGFDASESETRVPAPTATASTGCGSQIHTDAFPLLTFWLAPAVGVADTVIPLEAKYASRSTVVTLPAQTCGCSSEFVGCAVWLISSPTTLARWCTAVKPTVNRRIPPACIDSCHPRCLPLCRVSIIPRGSFPCPHAYTNLLPRSLTFIVLWARAPSSNPSNSFQPADPATRTKTHSRTLPMPTSRRRSPPTWHGRCTWRGADAGVRDAQRLEHSLLRCALCPKSRSVSTSLRGSTTVELLH
ncbi:hypothetical protein C8R46DRAFT_1088595 [Mycena filopes]|nr:hypothetical protein C8R46DRAFT_1088595 [Mycena filopes]